MPELPEVETTCRGIAPHSIQQIIETVIVRQPQLRWCIPDNLADSVRGQTVQAVTRRGKYILIRMETGHIIIHLGMSGSLRFITDQSPAEKHDHVDIVFANKCCLRYHDPRRFGCILWTDQPLSEHFLLKKLGHEPLEKAFDSDYFYQCTQGRKRAIKTLIMDSHIVVGVGNIYASEALFLAGIHPKTPAKNLTVQHCKKLVAIIKQVLQQAIQQGGTTLKDFVNSEGKAGYFQQSLHVYGRKNQACLQCTTPIEQVTIGQRSSFYCPQCQKHTD